MAQATAQGSAVRHKRGGLYFEDFAVGHLYEHPLTRTVTQMDNMLFSNMTLNPQPLHIDRHFCEQETEWGQPLMNSLFTLGLMIGIMVNHLTVGTTIANLGMTEVKFPHPSVRRRHRALHHRSHQQAGVAHRGLARESSNSITAPTTRTTSSWPNVAARCSCACDRPDALAPLRAC